MQKYIVLLFITFLVNSKVFTQITDIGGPLSFNAKYDLADSKAPVIAMPSFDLQRQLEEDVYNMQYKIGPYRFGFEHAVEYSPKNSGRWTILPNARVWKLRLLCEEALSVNLIFHDFYLPEGARLHIYNADHSMYDGAYTSENNNSNNMLGTELLKGEEVIIEYYEPNNVLEEGRLLLGTVVHGYRDINNWYPQKVNESGACNMDVICADGDPWRSEIRSVVRIVVGGGLCSGTLLNNTAQDGTPYILTANHCDPNHTSIGSAVFKFNYDSPTCGSQTVANSNPASVNHSMSGSTYRANKADSDFLLVELNSVPPEVFGVYYAGWDNSGDIPQSAVGIHHPRGDVKKISFDDDPLTSTQVLSLAANSVWMIEEWERNTTTEGGSSGSGLWDQNHRVIGQLFGGEANCLTSVKDYYGKFSMSWTGNGASSSAQRLKDWLDPQNTGATTLSGYDPYATGGDIAIIEVLNPKDSICVGYIQPEVVVQNFGNDTLYNFSLTYDVDGGTSETYIWDGTLLPGDFDTLVLPDYTVTSAGGHFFTINADLMNGDSDTDTSNNKITSNFETGTYFYCREDGKPISFGLYPNPVEGEFNMNLFFWEEVLDIKVEVLEASGRIVFKKNYYKDELVYSNSLMFSTYGMSRGAYYVRVTALGYQNTEKLIKY